MTGREHPPRQMRLVGWRPLVKQSLRGFAVVAMPNGLVIYEVVIGESDGRHWAHLPSRPMLDHDGNPIRDGAGKLRYAPVLEWSSSKLRHKFSRRVVELVREEHLDALDESGR
jgi:hypothetical protein